MFKNFINTYYREIFISWLIFILVLFLYNHYQGNYGSLSASEINQYCSDIKQKVLNSKIANTSKIKDVKYVANLDFSGKKGTSCTINIVSEGASGSTNKSTLVIGANNKMEAKIRLDSINQNFPSNEDFK